MRMRIASRVRVAGPVTALAGVTALTVAGLATPASAAPRQAGAAPRPGDPTVTRVFRYTGGTQRFFVPPGVRFVSITAAGASGQSSRTAAGGLGAIVTSTVAVFPRSTLLVRVGGSGSQGGFNGGGHGPGRGGTGGGASDVSTAIGHRLVVAAGGGGAGAAGSCLSAGGDGGDAGAVGSTGAHCVVPGSGGHGGGAGSSAAGGTGGSGGVAGPGGTPGTAGGNGILGSGGAGTTTAGTTAGESGGGGGGYYGGGGGGSGGLTGTDTGAGGGGGGGSSLGHVIGLAFGPASVTIRYTVTARLTIDTSSPLPYGVAGHFYRTILAASGGRPPYRWSLAAGSLPRGLTLSRTGVISGTPATAGTRFFTARVTDSLRRSVTKVFRLTIAGHSDLAIRLRHLGRFRHGRVGRYQIAVTNTGSAATSASQATEVALTLPRGLVVRHGGVGTFWQCHKHLHSALCTRRAPIQAHATTTITVTVFVRARAGTVQRAQAAVFPSDATPADNTATDLAFIYRR